MPNGFSLFPLLAPLAFYAASALSAWQSGRASRALNLVARCASALSLFCAALLAFYVSREGALTTPSLVMQGVGLSLRLDALSTVMFSLVSILGALVLRYSRTYLEGDTRHGAFLGAMCATIASVLLLVLAGNVLLLVLAWMATGTSLCRLLLFSPERAGAKLAARKTWIVARFGDLCFAAAAFCLWQTLGTLDIATLGERASEFTGQSAPRSLHLATFLLAFGAIWKSAQFPTSAWLLDVIETPTPVSALLHAGILNGGTFTLVRLSHALTASPSAMHLLIVVGASTALLASIAMTSQSSIKASLAYSSAAHMGFMLMLCGLGAFSVAILHLVAHSFYKAHAFLSSGGIVDSARAPKAAAPPQESKLSLFGIGVLLALALFMGVALALGVSLSSNLVSLALGAVLVMGLSYLLAQALHQRGGWRVCKHALLSATTTTLAFFVLELAATRLLGSVLPLPSAPGQSTLALMFLVVAAFSTAIFAQAFMPRWKASRLGQAAYVHFRQGLYSPLLFDRLIATDRPSDQNQAHQEISR